MDEGQTNERMNNTNNRLTLKHECKNKQKLPTSKLDKTLIKKPNKWIRGGKIV